MFGNLWNRAKNFFGNAIGTTVNKIKDVIMPVEGDKNIPPAVRRFLRDHGNETINSLKVVRAPISSMLDKALNLVSRGGFEKGKEAGNIDKFFHLFLVVNDSYRIEKNQLVKCMNYTQGEKDESMNIPVNGSLTINELLNNAVGNSPDDFWKNYSAFDKNCQWWVMRVLNANGLATADVQSFVKQSLEQVLPQMGQFTQDFSNKTTDLGAYLDEGLQNMTNGLASFKHGGLVHRDFNRPFPAVDTIGNKRGLFQRMVEGAAPYIAPLIRPFMRTIGFHKFKNGGRVKL